ncbi:Pentatricopeptide repeat-containing protein [Abeliophyllum distichum]|uniref:Pentatricopeptide repeat-containing protein n=1 Tax=Abeliophyllum distichum TaxID=126358 RepID=A0ABD1SY05_9LAMI
MQALSIWPSRNESWPSFVVTQLDYELGSCYNSIKRKQRRKIFDFCDSLTHRNGNSFRSQKWDMRCKSFCMDSRPEVYLFSKPKKGCFGASFALAWASEERAVGNNVMKENFDSLNDFSENKDFGRVRLEGIKEGDSTHGNKYDSESGDGGDGDNDDDDREQGEIHLKEKVHSENSEKLYFDRVQLEGVNERNSARGNKCDTDGGDDQGKRRIHMKENERNENSTRIDVRALAWSLHSARTAEDVGEVLRDKGELPVQVYSSILRGFGKDKRLESAMALVEWLKRKSKETNSSIRLNAFIYNSLLGVVKETENYDFVEKVINDMAVEGVHPNVVTYNTLMGIYIEQGQEVEALNLFEEMPQKGVSPSPASYSTVLIAYHRLEDGFGALKFYIDVKDKYKKDEIRKGVDENWEYEFSKLENFCIRICFQVMRRWLVNSENLSTDLLRLLKEMDRAGLRPGRTEYERLVWACTREEHCAVAKEFYTRIRERNTEISLSVCNHVIWLMGKAKKWWAALEIYEDLLDKGPKPNNMSYELIVSHFNILLSAARKRGIWRWGLRLLNKMEDKGLKPGSREWNSVLVACSKASVTSAAVQIFKRMVEQGEKPTIISYGALLSALEKGKLYDEALLVWKHMIKVGVEPNLYAYTIMASIYAGQGKFNIVDSIIREMVSVGVEPTVVTFNAIISGCARNDFGSAAYEWFQRMKLQNITPNEVTYEMLIEALANDGKPRLAYELYLRAQNEDLVLSSKAYDAVVRSSEVYEATIDVSTLGHRPPEKKKKVQIRKNLSEFCSIADVPRRSKPFDKQEIYTEQTEGLHR